MYYTARALMRLQMRFGAFPVIKGVGPAATAVADLLKRMRLEVGSEAPPVGEPSVCCSSWEESQLKQLVWSGSQQCTAVSSVSCRMCNAADCSIVAEMHLQNQTKANAQHAAGLPGHFLQAATLTPGHLQLELLACSFIVYTCHYHQFFCQSY